jgi:hypothetical protein
MVWSNEERKNKIIGFINDGLSDSESPRLAKLLEKKETTNLNTKEFTEFISLWEKRCHLTLKKMKKPQTAAQI